MFSTSNQTGFSAMVCLLLFSFLSSNYWMRSSMIWRIMQLSQRRWEEDGGCHHLIDVKFPQLRELACSAGVFFERAICSRKRHVEISRRERRRWGEYFFFSPPPSPLSFFRPCTYRKGYYFYSPQSSTVIKLKMAATTILRTRTRYSRNKICWQSERKRIDSNIYLQHSSVHSFKK